MSSGLSWTVPSLRLWTITGTPSWRENKHWFKNNPAKKGLSSCTMLILHSTTTEERVCKNYCIDNSASSVAMVNFNIGGDAWVVEWATTWTWDCMNASLGGAWLHESMIAWMHALGGVWLHEGVIAWMHQWEVSDCIKAWRLQWVTGSAWLVNAWLCQCLTGGQSMPISSIFFFSLTNWVTNTKLVPTKESLNNFTCMVASKFKPLLFHLAKSIWTRKIW